MSSDLVQAAFYIQRELERLRAAGAPEESLTRLEESLTHIRLVDSQTAITLEIENPLP